MTQHEVEREIRSGWKRTTLATIVAISSLAGSTYIVIDKITTFESNLNKAIERTESNDTRIARLEAARAPDGEQRGELTATMKLVLQSLDEIKRRLERIESRRDSPRD